MANGIIDKTRKAVSDVLGKVSALPAKQDEVDSVKAKAANIDEYVNATKPKPPAPPAAPTPPTPMDKVNSKAQYGDRGGEKRIDTSDMVKPLGSFHEGTDKVTKTGHYKLEKGEAVLNKDDANKYRNAKDNMHLAASALAHNGEIQPKKEEKPAKKLKHIITRKSTDGKIIHEHHHTEPMHHPMEEHVSTNQDDMVEHMLEHMGEKNDGEQDADDGKSGIEERESGAEAQDEALGA